MKPKAKKLTTGVLALTAVAIWIPQLLMGVVQKAPDPRPEVGNFGAESGTEFDEGAEGEGDLELQDDTFADPALEDQMEGTDEGGHAIELPSGSLSDQLQATSKRLESFNQGQQRIDLDQLLNSFRAPESHSTPTVAPEPVVEEFAPTPEPRLDRFPPVVEIDPLAVFAEQNSLNAIIHGEAESLAMVGNRIVRPGDELVAGVQVIEIEPRRILLRSAASSRWLALPPFRTRAATGGEESLEEETSDEDTGDASSSPPAQQAPPALSVPLENTEDLQALIDTPETGQAPPSEEEND